MNRRGAVAALIATIVLLVAGAVVVYEGNYFIGGRTPATPAVEARGVDAARVEKWKPAHAKVKARMVSDSERDDLLRRAQVWRQPALPIEQFDFRDPPPVPALDCRFTVTAVGGTTPKFDCDLPSGETARIKYGRSGELQAEYGATRLLRAFGFGADSVDYVAKVRCFGCPEAPFSLMKAVEVTKAEKIYKSLLLSYDSYEEFDWGLVEKKFPARPIESEKLEGWALFELDKVDEAKGGAPRSHVDALRLLAVFLAHWDNKSKNQRLVCLSQDDWADGEGCKQPFLLLQDVGATFGPSKVDLDEWKAAPIWDDRTTCRASMDDLPYDGATFAPVHISEAGRRMLAGMLTRLTDQQMNDLFSAGRFDQPVGLLSRRSPVADWVAVLKAKIREIADGPACRPTT